jgi:hypothetical protein
LENLRGFDYLRAFRLAFFTSIITRGIQEWPIKKGLGRYENYSKCSSNLAYELTIFIILLRGFLEQIFREFFTYRI